MTLRIIAAVFAVAAFQAASPSPDGPTPGAIVLLGGKTDAAATDALRRALVHADPDVRRAAARVASAAHPEVFDGVLAALAVERDPGVAAELVKDAVALGGHKGLARVEPHVERNGVNAVAEFAEWFARMDADGFVARLPAWSRVARADVRLPRIVHLAVRQQPDARERILAAWKAVASEAGWRQVSEPKPSERLTGVTMRTPTGLAETVFESTLTAAGCQPGGDRLGSALLRYVPDGRLRAIELDPDDLSTQCREALIAIARISMDPGDSVDAAQRLVMPLIPDFVRCKPESKTAPVAIGPADDTSVPVLSPRLKREVKPNYTEAPMRAKIEGVVELEGVVYESGCVGRLSVTRSLQPELDREALRAVSQWRFAPGSRGGTPVPVKVNMELTFTLRR